MTETLEPLAAGEVYEAVVEPRRRTRGGRIGAAALDLWCAAFGGLFELSGEAEVVVRRRVDGGTELRVPAGDPESAGMLLSTVREQLETMAPDEFRATWSMD